MDLTELNDEDLRSLIEEGREALEEGAPVSVSIRRYGIRDEEEFELWLERAEAELARR